MNMLITDLDGTLFAPMSPSDDALASIRHITRSPGALELLTLPNFRNFLVSAGEPNIQNIKLGILRIGHLFHGIYTGPHDRDKRFIFEELLETHGRGVPRSDIFVIGSKADAEIRFGNELGLTTLLITGAEESVRPHARTQASLAKSDTPAYRVSTLGEAANLLRDIAIEGIVDKPNPFF